MTLNDFAKDAGLSIKPQMEQLERAKRWYKRAKESENGSIEQYDFLLAFFTSCHHLRDFLKVSGISEEKLSKVVNSQEMKICRDICNESKHCSLSKPSFYTSLQNGKKHTGLFDGVVVLREFFPVRGSFFTVVVQGDKYDAVNRIRASPIPTASCGALRLGEINQPQLVSFSPLFLNVVPDYVCI